MAAYFFFCGPTFGGSAYCRVRALWLFRPTGGWNRKNLFLRLTALQTLPPFGRSFTRKIFYYASRHYKHFRPKGRQVSTNIGELYRLAKVRLSW